MNDFIVRLNKNDDEENYRYYKIYLQESKEILESLCNEMTLKDLDEIVSSLNDKINVNLFNLGGEKYKLDPLEFTFNLKMLLKINSNEIRRVLGTVNYIDKRSNLIGFSLMNNKNKWVLKINSEYRESEDSSAGEIVEEIAEVDFPSQLTSRHGEVFISYFTLIVIYLVNIVVNNMYRN